MMPVKRSGTRPSGSGHQEGLRAIKGLPVLFWEARNGVQAPNANAGVTMLKLNPKSTTTQKDDL